MALLVTDAIAEEIAAPATAASGWVGTRAYDYPIDVWFAPGQQPIAMRMTDWIQEHLLLYARQLWRSPYRASTG